MPLAGPETESGPKPGSGWRSSALYISRVGCVDSVHMRAYTWYVRVSACVCGVYGMPMHTAGGNRSCPPIRDWPEAGWFAAVIVSLSCRYRVAKHIAKRHANVSL